VNSRYHAQSAARKWGGEPEHYLPIEEFLDSSKQVIGDVRHRALYHHTLGVFLCERIFGKTLDIPKSAPDGQVLRPIRVPVRLIAERHILEDLGYLPSPADYLKDTPVATWMSGKRREDVDLAALLLKQSSFYDPNHEEINQ
jgi:hypothetical protein